MTRIFLVFFVLCLLPTFGQDEKDYQYIQKYGPIAVQEMELYKIPASITLAQGLVETADGQSELAKNANNHFGIKCKAEWKGLTYRYSDDAPNECFRKYNSVEESYRDHSKFLAERPYYKLLFTFEMTDYKAWAFGLKKSGYATNPKYAYILINRIEKYNLNRLDYLNSDNVKDSLEAWYGFSYEKEDKVEIEPEKINPPAPQIEHRIPVPEKAPYQNPAQRKVRHANGLYYVISKPGENLADLAHIYDVPEWRLARYNDLKRSADLKTGQKVFLSPKKVQGTKMDHVVQPGETMYSIAQDEGLRLKKLYKLNRMSRNEKPKVGEKLLLQKVK